MQCLSFDTVWLSEGFQVWHFSSEHLHFIIYYTGHLGKVLSKVSFHQVINGPQTIILSLR